MTHNSNYTAYVPNLIVFVICNICKNRNSLLITQKLCVMVISVTVDGTMLTVPIHHSVPNNNSNLYFI